MDKQHVTLLVLLDLSAVFDTIDHNIFLDQLESSFGITDSALKWFSLYLYQQNPIWRVSIKQSVITIGVSHKVPV